MNAQEYEASFRKYITLSDSEEKLLNEVRNACNNLSEDEKKKIREKAHGYFWNPSS